MAYQSWSVVYGEQPSASKWNILGTNDAHFYSFLGANEAWQSYTPTLTNLSGANNTVTAAYIRIGNIVRVSVVITLGVGFSMPGAVVISMPVTGRSDYATTARGGTGFCRYTDVSPSANYYGHGRVETTTTFTPLVMNVSSTYASQNNITSTVPFTWASTDYMQLEWEYEAAA